MTEKRSIHHKFRLPYALYIDHSLNSAQKLNISHTKYVGNCAWFPPETPGIGASLDSDTPVDGDKTISHPQGNTAFAPGGPLRCALSPTKGTLLTQFVRMSLNESPLFGPKL